MNTIPGQANTRYWNAVKRADGSPITTGTVNYYLVAVTGANAGKWYRGSDTSWQEAEAIAGAMTYKGGSEWGISLPTGVWTDGVEYRAYGKESTDLHIPHGDSFRSESWQAATLKNGAHGGAGATITLQTPIAASGNWNVGKTGYSLTTAPLVAADLTTILGYFTTIMGATWSASDTLENIRNATTGSGAGLPTATITVKNTNTGGAAVPGVTVYIYESTNTTKQAEGITNVSGIAAIITPGNATYKVRLYKAGWTQTTNPNTIVVSGDTPAEFYMTAFTPTPPSGTQTCTLYGTLRTANGADYAGQAVSARLDRAAWFDTEGAALSIQAVSTTTGADGYFELELARNATYLVTCAAHGVDDRAAVIGDVATLDYETAIAP